MFWPPKLNLKQSSRTMVSGVPPTASSSRLCSVNTIWIPQTVPFFATDNITEGEVLVDPKHHKHFVARRGEVLRRISDDYGGVLISFPRQGKHK